MKIVFVSLVLNIHGIGLSDELYKLTNGEYKFISTGMLDSENDKGGGNKQFETRPYLLRVNNYSSKLEALKLIREADMMIYGAASAYYLKERLKTYKLTFIASERWLKKGLVNILSPSLLKKLFTIYLYAHNKPFYALCNSAYAAKDYSKLQILKNKYFKWGYFTSTKQLDLEYIIKNKHNASCIKILWVARFLKWKHPELMIQLGKKLNANHINFSINMIGVGPLLDRINRDIINMGLSDQIHLLGALPNEKVMELMREHHIFCFTSDKNEGWGAVLNEAMSNGCCPVSSIEIGSTPYLIKNGVNGLSFDLKKGNSLFEKVYWLIKHTEEREKMSIEAYNTINNLWNPQNAAKQLYYLSESLLHNNEYNVLEGPCSKA